MADVWSKRRRAIARARKLVVEEAKHFFFGSPRPDVASDYAALLRAVESLRRAEAQPKRCP